MCPSTDAIPFSFAQRRLPSGNNTMCFGISIFYFSLAAFLFESAVLTDF
jgi:hypothetical protein